MKKKIKNFVKKNKVLYTIYNKSFSILILILKCFVKQQNNKVLFVVYGGRRYDDSPKFIYEYLKENSDYDYLEKIWAFENPSEFPEVTEKEKIKIDTLKYYIYALKSKYWITNSSIDRGLKLKNKGTKYVIFQHGTLGIKKIGYDLTDNTKSFKNMKLSEVDYFIYQGNHEEKLILSALGYGSDIAYKLGLPRNLDLIDVNVDKIVEFKKKYNIPLDKKVILYAPTYREFYNENISMESYLKMPFEINDFVEKLSDEYVLAITAHYEVEKMLDISTDNEKIFNFFGYGKINDLINISDLLITDYSSIVFDYYITEKPVFCFAYDYDRYVKERGTYIDLDKLFYNGVIKEQSILFDAIKKTSITELKQFSKLKKEEYIYINPECIKESVEIIFK